MLSKNKNTKELRGTIAGCLSSLRNVIFKPEKESNIEEKPEYKKVEIQKEKVELENIIKGDVVKLFGSKVKLTIKEDQNVNGTMTGINAKEKPIKFTMKDVAKIIRDGKAIYQVYE